MAKKSKTDEAAQQALEATPPDTITKAEAIRRALAAGHDQPATGIAFIQSEFGLDVSPTHYSAAKSQEKSKGAIKKASTRRTIQATRPKNVSIDADLLGSLEALKPLVAALGAEKVKRLADLLG